MMVDSNMVSVMFLSCSQQLHKEDEEEGEEDLAGEVDLVGEVDSVGEEDLEDVVEDNTRNTIPLQCTPCM